MGLIHRTKTTTEIMVHRHPIIMEKKTEYLRRRRLMFYEIFVDEYYKSWEKKYGNHWSKSMKSRMSSISKPLWSPKAMVIGEDLKRVFGYSERTNVIDILFIFRRLFIKLYPDDRA